MVKKSEVYEIYIYIIILLFSELCIIINLMFGITTEKLCHIKKNY